MVFQKGHKSKALRLFGIILVSCTSIGLVAYFINLSTEQTNKVSFKSAGLQYRKYFKAVEIMSLPDTSIEENQTPRKYVRKILKKVFVNGTEHLMSVEEPKSINASLKRVVKESLATETPEISSDLKVLSSFDCVKSIPKVLLDYISNMFVSEYGRSHKDFHSQNIIEETLPLLKQFNLNCGVDQNCIISFQYDKKYGLNTTADNTFLTKDVFYCCPSAHSSKNETISNLCKRAQTVSEKSIFRESKESSFLGRVTEFSHVLVEAS